MFLERGDFLRIIAIALFNYVFLCLKSFVLHTAKTTSTKHVQEISLQNSETLFRYLNVHFRDISTASQLQI